MSYTKAERELIQDINTILKQDAGNYIKALMHLYNKGQTDGEKRHGRAYLYNKKGFDRHDSKALSPIATTYVRNKTLKPTQMAVLKARIPRYWRQLEEPFRKELEELHKQPPVQQRFRFD